VTVDVVVVSVMVVVVDVTKSSTTHDGEPASVTLQRLVMLSSPS
jgi:hypothetical protein